MTPRMVTPRGNTVGRRPLTTGAIVCLLATGITAPSAPAVGFAKPIPPTQVTKQDHPDPTAVIVNGRVWTYATDGPAGARRKVAIRTAGSVDGPYHQVGKALWPIPWARASSAIFAPDVWRTSGSRVLLYFAATPSYNKPDDPSKCVAVAVSTRGVGGPFIPRPKPLACADHRNGAIDPDVFVDPVSHRTYLLYKTNGEWRPHGPISRIWMQQLTGDGLHKVGPQAELVQRHRNIENPSLVRNGGRYFLFVSRQPYDSYIYNTSVLSSAKLFGPYTGERVLLNSRNTSAAGPGGADIVPVPGVGTVAFFHGWIARRDDCIAYRRMYVTTIAWDAAGGNPHLAEARPGNPTC